MDYWTEGTRHGARLRWTPNQRAVYVGLALGLVACAAIHPPAFLRLLGIAILTLYGLVVLVRVCAVLAGLLRANTVTVGDDELAGLDDEELPVYTLLLPVYREAEVLPDLLAAIAAMDYPAAKLDVKLLLEADDDTGIAAARDLPPWVEAITVPEGEPKTKPRACNVGLAAARGEFLVIFDAEDRPEPRQLRQAVAAFRRLPADVVCLQARLNYYNSRERLLTRWQALEYTTWFDLYLPGLHALRAPIPLGGTSNHFRIDALRELHGWDPYNVTEDCDLGMRLARRGWRTEILDSTTWEEAVPAWRPWLRQRSRWMKGYWQTHLCQTRRSRGERGRLGPWQWPLMLVTVGGQVLSLLINPLCWALAAAWLLWQWDLYNPHVPATVAFVIGSIAFGLFNILFVVIHAIGALRRRRPGLLAAAVVMPLYWIAVSAGAWRGFLQFFTEPFKWEKTPHGMPAGVGAIGSGEAVGQVGPVGQVRPVEPAVAAQSLSRSTPARGARRYALVVALIVLGIVVVSARAPEWLGIYREVRLANVRMSGDHLEHEIALEQSWFGRREATITLSCARGAAPKDGSLRALIYITAWDGEWFQCTVDTLRVNSRNGHLDLTVPLDAGWQSQGTALPWGPWCLRRVRTLGVRLYGDTEALGPIRVVDVTASGRAAREPLAAELVRTPEAAAAYEVIEARLAVSRHYRNPFDAREIDIWGVIEGPDGTIVRTPAFYTRDYRRSLSNGEERHRPVSAPYWAVRHAPKTPGRHRLYAEGKDAHGDAFRTAAAVIDVSPSPHRGYVRADTGGQYFAFENDDFYYPVAMNIRSPDDQLFANVPEITMPNSRSGTYAMDKFIDRMADAGVTMGRVWMMPGWLGLEWRADWPGYHGPEFYNLHSATQLDHLMARAEERGVHIDIALNQHGPYTEQHDSKWADNPFSVQAGGTLATGAEIMTNREARERFRNSFRYIAARWGASPAVFGWTLWIEADVVNRDGSALLDWHREMAPYMRSVDGGRHLVSTEFASPGGDTAVFSLPEIDYVQVAAYNWGGGMPNALWGGARHMRRYGKPAVLEEYSGHVNGGGLDWMTHEIHDGLWMGWTLPVAATPMPWWWNLIFEKNLTRFQTRFAEFIDGEDLRGRAWQFRQLPVKNGAGLRARVRCARDRAFLWVYGPISSTTFRGGSIDPARPTASYRRLARGFDVFAEPPEAMFPAVGNATISIARLGLAAGQYDVEFWDTWTSDEPRRQRVHIDADTPLALPELVRDVAIKIKRVEP